MYDVAVIGGGAAGFFAAIRAASEGASVVILEKNTKLLAKVLVSGGGRCNVTHHCFDPAELILAYPRGSRELLGPFTRFGPVQVIEWFHERGVELKTEADGRMFPVTDSSSTIIRCFLQEAERLGIRIITSFAVRAIQKGDQQWSVHAANGGAVDAKKLIIAAGGLSGSTIPEWLSAMGHSISSPVPSLFTFNVPVHPFEGLMGISVKDARIRIPGTKFDFSGPILFTHWGLSGPVVLRCSAWAARFAFESGYKFDVLVSFAGSLTEDEVRDHLRLHAKESSAKLVVNTPMFQLPSRLWERICDLSGITGRTKWADVGKQMMQLMIQYVLTSRFQVIGKTTFREEFVTCGGIQLREVNMKTMESRMHPGLFFAGEVLDIDGITGGYNFQAAWTTGWLAGSAAAIQ